nr:hypothetical protein [Pandoravirus massiliensis]
MHRALYFFAHCRTAIIKIFICIFCLAGFFPLFLFCSLLLYGKEKGSLLLSRVAFCVSVFFLNNGTRRRAILFFLFPVPAMVGRKDSVRRGKARRGTACGLGNTERV